MNGCVGGDGTIPPTRTCGRSAATGRAHERTVTPLHLSLTMLFADGGYQGPGFQKALATLLPHEN